ncbi:uncharacterized protein MYCFIDRAFT_76626 [Pseudocercospora fijiensis CIRAD86]|uniref:Uncharacterized protein n=1 Tax=Pseudocercospora fijiensis (strain CIRAD86) TaxID=383855 RepID=N1QB73_PSEFD|nr:uncharacterized protein MYCFIDRAFT_76626 [Pseudocercospora fijiensis CIRAD86]EME89281.1 hypothetical protein MYCFIDRAFT_76626 [Pseudocercospora fijiensis CIRAD86]
MREQFGVRGNGFTDGLASLFCSPCTLGQMERETKHRKGHPRPTQSIVTTPYGRDTSSMGSAVPTARGSEAHEAPYVAPAAAMAYTPANHPAAAPAPVADSALAKHPTAAPVPADLTHKEKVAPPPVVEASDPAKAASTHPVDAAPPIDANAPVKPPSPHVEKVEVVPVAQ